MSSTRVLPAVALALCTTVSAAQAETVWRFPFKGTPYAVPTDGTKNNGSHRSGAKYHASERAKRSACHLTR